MLAVVLTVVGVAAGIFFILGPILVKASAKNPAFPEVETIQPEQIPQPVSDFFQNSMSMLEGEGFELVSYIYWLNEATNTETFISLIGNRREKDYGILVAMFSDAEEVQISLDNYYVEFSTDYAEGVEVNTLNSKIPSVFPQKADLLRLQVPGADPKRLYEIHRKLAERCGARKTTKYLPALEDPAAFLGELMSREVKDAMKAGYLYLDKEGKNYLPTWKGAFLMTWKLLWPISMILRITNRYKIRKTLGELGIDSVRKPGR